MMITLFEDIFLRMPETATDLFADPPGLVLIEEILPRTPRTGLTPTLTVFVLAMAFALTVLVFRGLCLATLSRIGKCAANKTAGGHKNKLPKKTNKNMIEALFINKCATPELWRKLDTLYYFYMPRRPLSSDFRHLSSISRKF